MRILVANAKGGVGKTTAISLNIAMNYGFHVLTNDNFSRIDKIIGDKALILEEGQALPETPDNFHVIYDMGGKVDARLIQAAEIADIIIVPTIYGTFFDEQGAVSTIAALEEYNSNILIVANNTQRGDYKRICEEMSQHFSYPVLELKKSTAFKTAIHKRQSIAALVKSNALAKYHFSTPLKQTMAIVEKAVSMIKENAAVTA